jgi:hypothetical protein
MGKGGEKSTTKGLTAKKANWKLANMETEVLRKWAKAYNIDKKVDERDALLEQLVSDDAVSRKAAEERICC